MREIEMVADLLAKPEPSAETTAAGRRRLQREKTARRPRRGLVFGGLGGLTTLVAGGAAAAVLITGGGEQVRVEPALVEPGPGEPGPVRLDTTASALQKAAEQAETASWGSGKYWYVKSDKTLAGGHGLPADPRESGISEIWMARDGQTWHKLSPGRLKKMRGKTGFNVCDRDVGYQELHDLPTKPSTLRAELRRWLSKDAMTTTSDFRRYRLNSCMIDLLGVQPAPPKLRAAVFRSLADLPETRELGTGTDRAGRKGAVLTISSGKSLHKLIVDPATSAILQLESFQSHGGFTLLQIRTFYKTGWTDTPPS